MRGILAVPYICRMMILDWPVQPIPSPRTAERMRISLAGFTIHLEPGRYVIARPVPKRRGEFQVWGSAGTYAIGHVENITQSGKLPN